MLKTENTAYAGATFAGIIGGLSWGDIGAIFGILFGLFTLLINWYYKDREIKLKEKALQHNIDMQQIEQTAQLQRKEKKNVAEK